MLGTHTVRDLIKRGEFGGLKEIMEKSRALGMVTFDSTLFGTTCASRSNSGARRGR